MLSVVLFCRNCERTLGAALESVVSQSCDVELLVLDGGSTDRSVEIIRKYERHIAFWRSLPDGSSTNAINEGVRRATGQVIGLLAGDDWYEPESLGKVVRYFQNNPELDVLSCGTRFAYFDEAGRFLFDKTFTDRNQLSFDLLNLFRRPLTCGRFVRRRLYEGLGGFAAAYKSSDDLDFLIRLCLSGPKTEVNTNLTYTYRAHPGSRTLGGDRDILLMMARDNIDIAETYLAKRSLSRQNRNALLALHGQYAARGAWNCLRRGRLIDANSFVKRALETSSIWPAMLFYWFVSGVGSKVHEKLKGFRAGST